MTGKQAPRRTAASTLLTAVVLVAGAWALPSLAATGNGARCDQSMDTPPMSPAREGSLAMRVIDHGTATSLATDALPLDEADTAVAPDAAGESSVPRVELTLSEMLDQSVAVEETENEDKPSPVVEADPAEATAEPPGLSNDDLERYRQQMYRRDI